MTSASILSLTVRKASLPTETSAGVYTYFDAVRDARGKQSNAYSGSPSPAHNTLYLWDSGCRVNETYNCTMSCLDREKGPSLVWNSPDAMFTLQNCLVYPILATAAANHWLVEDPPGLLDDFRVTVSDSLSVDSATQGSGDSMAWPVINNCLGWICVKLYGTGALEECSVDKSSYDTRYQAGPSNISWSPSLTLREKLCFDQPQDRFIPNADLGGPGILLSIVQQVTIVMIMWLLLSCTKWFRDARNACVRRNRTTVPRRGKVRRAFEKQTAALIVTLQEFQRTQVFFLIALQAVALLAMRYPNMLDAPTILQLYGNIMYIVMASIAGVYPIVLGLITLRKSKGRLEWFTLLTSAACVGVSSSAWVTVGNKEVSRSQLRQEGFNPDYCGYINPFQHCIEPGAKVAPVLASQLPALSQWLSIGPACAVVYLLIERTISTLKERHFIRTPGCIDSMARGLVWIPDWMKTGLQTIVVLCLEAWLLWANINIFGWFFNLFRNPGQEARVWSIGQVIGVAVWIPVILEWAYLAIRGVEETFTIRLPPNYKVVKTDAKNAPLGQSSTPRANPDTSQQSGTTIASYELLQNPSGDTHRVAQGHAYSPA